MAFTVNNGSEVYVCARCGKRYTETRNGFYKCYGEMHKGTGFLHVCKACVDDLYQRYLTDCLEPQLAVRSVCRRLDIYWNSEIYEHVAKTAKSTNIMSSYISRSNTIKYVGKCYDDTLVEEGTLFKFLNAVAKDDGKTVSQLEEEADISDDVKAFWGPGYTAKDYLDLEQRRSYWQSKYPPDIQMDVGTEALIRQICNLELDINKQRSEGKPIDKSVNSLNTLLGSLNLKPNQNVTDTASSDSKISYGQWIRKLEDTRPVPEVDPSLRDVDHLIRYIDIWYRGHLAKLEDRKNAYSALYEKEIERLRVDRPEYDGDDDETFFNDVFDWEDDESVGGDANE